MVASNEPDRGQWCVALLSAMTELAFTEMQLHWLDTIVPCQDAITRTCYRRAGFEEKEMLAARSDARCQREFTVRLVMVNPHVGGPP